MPEAKSCDWLRARDAQVYTTVLDLKTTGEALNGDADGGFNDGREDRRSNSGNIISLGQHGT